MKWNENFRRFIVRLTWSALSHQQRHDDKLRQVGATMSVGCLLNAWCFRGSNLFTASARLELWNISNIQQTFRFARIFHRWIQRSRDTHRYTAVEQSVRFHQLQQTVEFFHIRSSITSRSNVWSQRLISNYFLFK